MNFLRSLNVFAAVRDLRCFLSERRPHELGFFLLSVVLFGAILVGFTIDSHEERAYHREIIYVEQWPADRSDAQIRAQQAIDGPLKRKRLAAEKAARDKTQAEFRKLDDSLKKLGI